MNLKKENRHLKLKVTMNLKEENRHLKKKLNDAKKMLKKLVKSASYDSPGSRDTIYSMESEISEWLKSL